MRLGLYLSIAAATLTACSETTFFKDNSTPPGEPAGTILGRVCDPSGRHWLPDAMAYANLIDGSGKLYDTRKSYTDRDGYFLLDDMPAGSTYTVYIQFGGEVLETHSVAVGGGESVVIEEPDCFDPLELDVAVVTGDYDEFQEVLGHMGFANYELVDGLVAAEMAGFLMDLDKMLLYDIIIFNGGHVEAGLIYPVPPDDDDDDGGDGGPDSIFDDTGDVPDVPDAPEDDAPEDGDTGFGGDTGGGGDDPGPTEPVYAHDLIIENLRAYVAAGGAVYASDWAYDVVERAWPEAIDFVGADEVPDAAQLGEYGIVTATVSDGALAAWLETDYTDVEYDLPVWPPIEGVADTVSVHLTGKIDYRQGINIFTLSNSPLLVSFTSGDGKVAFSTFRVANNADSDVVLTLQYMMYSL
jgi:hypothetical protein